MDKTPQYHILIVDDAENWRDLLRSVFEDDFIVHTASSYAEAQQLLLEHQPSFDVAVIDVRLNDADADNKDGLRLLGDISEHHLGTKSIVLTGYASIKDATSAYRDLNALHYLEKYPSGGLNISALREVVRGALGSRRVLLVEDDPSWHEMLNNILVEEGYEVDSARSSEEARRRLQGYQYPIAVLDLKLGQETPDQGVDLLEFTHRVVPKIGIVVVSGYGTGERVCDAFERGRIKGFMFKDAFNHSVFLDKVRRAATR